jgi:hypothetical protein
MSRALPFLWVEVGLLRLSLYRTEPHDAQASVAVRQQLRERFDQFIDDQIVQQPALMA